MSALGEFKTWAYRCDGCQVMTTGLGFTNDEGRQHVEEKHDWACGVDSRDINVSGTHDYCKFCKAYPKPKEG